MRRLGSKAAVVSRQITSEEALTGNFDRQLVEMDAELVSATREDNRYTLTLRAQGHTFNASGEDEQFHSGIDGLREGALLRVAGICAVQMDTTFGATYVPKRLPWRTPEGFTLLLRTPGDVRLLRQAPWWDKMRALYALGLLALGVGVALAWVNLLRRTVRLQTAELESARQAAERARGRWPNKPTAPRASF